MPDEPVSTPPARSWRDLSQPLKPRAMSRGGRWRRALSGVRRVVAVAVLCGVAGVVWLVSLALSTDPKRVPTAAKAVPVRHFDLSTSMGGVLDSDWLQNTLALPRGTALMEVNLDRVRARLLADGQVATAAVARRFPDRLVVRITERSPVARVRVEADGEPRDLLVAPDGVVFGGHGFDPAMVATLPWLSGLTLIPAGPGFRPIPGMARVTRLLVDAQFGAAELYRNWQHVSLARLESDKVLEVTMKSGTVVVFDALGSYFVQLAKLDFLVEKLAHVPAGRARIDLTFGQNVPVMLEPVVAADTRGRPQPSALPAFFPSPISQPDSKREL